MGNAEEEVYLLDRSRPRESKAEEDNEEERSPEIPIAQGLTGILTVRVGKHHQLQIADDPREIPLDGVPDGLREGVWGGSEPGGDVGSGRRGRWRRSSRRGFWNWGLGFGRKRIWGQVGGDEGGRRHGDGDGSAWWTWWSRR